MNRAVYILVFIFPTHSIVTAGLGHAQSPVVLVLQPVQLVEGGLNVVGDRGELLHRGGQWTCITEIHRKRIKTEEKAKVVTSVFGVEIILFLALAIVH